MKSVDRVLARTLAQRNRERLIQCLGKLDATFHLKNDPALVPPLVDYLQATISGIGSGSEAERLRIGIALEIGFRPRRLSLTDHFGFGQHRGTALMYAFMDEVRYNDPGNEVTLIQLYHLADRSSSTFI